jgi:hypothetical protein
MFWAKPAENFFAALLDVSEQVGRRPSNPRDVTPYPLRTPKARRIMALPIRPQS